MARHEALSPADIEGIIREATQRLVKAAHPDESILFGSYARGDFDKDSDLDLLVILPTVESRFDEMVRLRRKGRVEIDVGIKLRRGNADGGARGVKL